MSRLLIAVWIAAGGILVFLLFVPPVVGLADQGDYGRITSAFKIQYPPDLPKADRDFCYIQTKFVVIRDRRSGSARLPYFSSELLFVGAAVTLHSILFNPSTFDIRALGAVHSVAFLAALGLVLYSGSLLSRTPKTALAVLLLFIFGDIGYLAYFNSFFSEPASFVFGLAYIGSALQLVGAHRRTLWHLSFVTISASLFIAAKSQNIPLAAVIAGFSLVLYPDPADIGQAVERRLRCVGLPYSCCSRNIVQPCERNQK